MGTVEVHQLHSEEKTFKLYIAISGSWSVVSLVAKSASQSSQQRSARGQT